MPWYTEPTKEFDDWFDGLSQEDQEHVLGALLYLERMGPAAKFPVSYPIKQPNTCGMKELRPASRKRSELRILYAFDPWRRALLLLGGDKAGNWTGWYDANVPEANRRFDREVRARRATANKDQVGHTMKQRDRQRKKGR